MAAPAPSAAQALATINAIRAKIGAALTPGPAVVPALQPHAAAAQSAFQQPGVPSLAPISQPTAVPLSHLLAPTQPDTLGGTAVSGHSLLTPNAGKSLIPITPQPMVTPEVHHLKAPSQGDILFGSLMQDPGFRAAVTNSTTPTAAITNAVLSSLAPHVDTQHGIVKGLQSLATPGNAMMALPGPIRGVKALEEGVQAVKAGEDVAGAWKAGKMAYNEAGPISSAIKQRVFKQGKYAGGVPAAGSRTGRIVEGAIDQMRPTLHKLGIVKSESEKAAQVLNRQTTFQQSVAEAPILMLAKVAKKLSTDEEYALRIVAEGAAPVTRIGHHVEQAGLGLKENALYHLEHANQVERSAKYITTDASGRAVLRDDAPEKLKEAWHWFQQTGDLREELLQKMSRLSDSQIASRIMAPARVLHGARYRKFEELVRESLEGSKGREEIHAAIDQLVKNPTRSHALKQWIDALSMSAGERAGKPLEPGALLSHVEGVHTPESAAEIPSNVLHQSGDFEVRRAQPGDDVMTYKGGAAPNESNPDRPAFNLYHQGEHVGSAQATHVPDRFLHVHSIYVKPGTPAQGFMHLAHAVKHYAEAWNLPLSAAFENEKLARVVEKWAQREGRGQGSLFQHEPITDFADQATREIAHAQHWSELMPLEAELRQRQWNLAQEVAPEAHPADIPTILSLLEANGNEEAVALDAIDKELFKAKMDTGFGSRNLPAEGQALLQRGSVYHDPHTGETMGSIPEASPFGVKGAIEFTPRNTAIIHLTTAADETTFVHELGHLVRRFGMAPREEARVASWAGAKLTNRDAIRLAKRRGETPPDPVYSWDRAAEEKFAKGLEQFVRTGRGPEGVKAAARRLAPAFREVYEHTDLPDVPPHVADFFNRLLTHKKMTGGSIVGAEDVSLGVAYAPSYRGMPLNRMTQPHKAAAAYIRRASSALFGGGRKAAIGGGPDDVALKKAYEGALLMNGFFTKEVAGPKVESAILALRMSAAHVAHKSLVQASEKIPGSVDDIALKVDPSIDAPDDLKALYDKLSSVERSGQKLGPDDVNRWNFDLIERARNGIFPHAGSAESRAESERMAQMVMETQKPVDNIVWVPREFIDQTGLLHVPAAARWAQRGMSARQMQLYRSAGVTWDAINDLTKAFMLYLNPAYVPVQFIGNLGMALFHQGAFMAPNLMRSALLSRGMEPIDRVTIDHLMQHGIYSATPMRTGPGEFVKQTVGGLANKMADWLPRRSAFLHEAYSAGFDSNEKIVKLLRAARAGDQESLETLRLITEKANDAMVDFDRMSPLERETIARYIIFYPWLRGATRYSIRFMADHPILSAGLAMAVDHMLVSGNDILGDRPYSEQLDVPLSTRSVGLSIPGVGGVGLDQLVGEHTWYDRNHPMIVNLRQFLTFTTPSDLLQAGIAFAGGPNKDAAGQLVQSLQPALYAAMVAGTGYDPYAQKQVPQSISTLLDQLSPKNNSPVWTKIKQLNEPQSQRNKSIHPRNAKEIGWSMGLGSMAPTPYNTQVGQARALKLKPTSVQRSVKLQQDTKAAGLGSVPPEAQEDLEWKTKYDQATKQGMSYDQRAAAAAKLYDERYGGTAATDHLQQLRTEGQAAVFLRELTHRLYGKYTYWDNKVQRRLRYRREQTKIGAGS